LEAIRDAPIGGDCCFSPYLIGWVLVLGIVVGLFYEALVVMILTRAAPRPITLGPALFIIMALGVLTLGGGISRLRHQTAERA